MSDLEQLRHDHEKLKMGSVIDGEKWRKAMVDAGVNLLRSLPDDARAGVMQALEPRS